MSGLCSQHQGHDPNCPRCTALPVGQGLLIDVPAHCGVDDDNQRFTTREALEWVKRMAGVDAFDLDVAACEESHHAPVWYGQGRYGFTDGLYTVSNPWTGRVFCNPPWGHIGPWVDTAWREMSRREGPITVAMILPGNRTHRTWWQELVEPVRDQKWPGVAPLILRVGDPVPTLTTHFAPKRFAYGGPGNPLGIGVAEPNFTSVAIVWRRAA